MRKRGRESRRRKPIIRENAKTINEAYSLGWEAAWKYNLNLVDNPYDFNKHPKLHAAWESGWWDA